jgi:hypothetical protein
MMSLRLLISAGLVVFVRDEMFVEDEEDDEDDGHDEGHEAEGVPRPVSRVQIGDADGAQDTGQTGARTQNAHPSPLKYSQIRMIKFIRILNWIDWIKYLRKGAEDFAENGVAHRGAHGEAGDNQGETGDHLTRSDGRQGPAPRLSAIRTSGWISKQKIQNQNLVCDFICKNEEIYTVGYATSCVVWTNLEVGLDCLASSVRARLIVGSSFELGPDAGHAFLHQQFREVDGRFRRFMRLRYLKTKKSY